MPAMPGHCPNCSRPLGRNDVQHPYEHGQPACSQCSPTNSPPATSPHSPYTGGGGGKALSSLRRPVARAVDVGMPSSQHQQLLLHHQQQQQQQQLEFAQQHANVALALENHRGFYEQQHRQLAAMKPEAAARQQLDPQQQHQQAILTAMYGSAGVPTPMWMPQGQMFAVNPFGSYAAPAPPPAPAPAAAAAPSQVYPAAAFYGGTPDPMAAALQQQQQQQQQQHHQPQRVQSLGPTFSIPAPARSATHMAAAPSYPPQAVAAVAATDPQGFYAAAAQAQQAQQHAQQQAQARQQQQQQQQLQAAAAAYAQHTAESAYNAPEMTCFFDMSSVSTAEDLCALVLQPTSDFQDSFEVQLFPLNSANLDVAEQFVANYHEIVDLQRSTRRLQWWIDLQATAQHPTCYLIQHTASKTVVGLVFLDPFSALLLDFLVLSLPEHDALARQAICMVFNVLHQPKLKSFVAPAYDYLRQRDATVRVCPHPENIVLRKLLALDGEAILGYQRRRDPLEHEIGPRDVYEAPFIDTALFPLLYSRYIGKNEAIEGQVSATYEPADRKLVCDMSKPSNVYSAFDTAAQLGKQCEAFFSQRRKASKSFAECRLQCCFLDNNLNRLRCFRGGKVSENKTVETSAPWLVQITHLQTTPLYKHSPVRLHAVLGLPIFLPNNREFLLPIVIASRLFEVKAEKSGRTNKHLFRPYTGDVEVITNPCDDLTRFGISIDRRTFEEACRRNGKTPTFIRDKILEFLGTQQMSDKKRAQAKAAALATSLSP